MDVERFSPVTDAVVRDLEALVGSRNVSVDPEKRESYSYDQVGRHLWSQPYLADAVVFPESTDHVAAVLRFASERRIPVTPRGAGTGLSGGAVPAFGGLVLAFDQMNHILEVDTENLTLTAEPGVVTGEITRAAARESLLYAGDPCSGDASFIGGNVAENAGGNKVIKYGPTGNSVLGMEVVLPDGSVTWFGGKRRKDVTGYDLAHLVVGSEGTLAVVTRVILRLMPLPHRVVDLLVPFRSTAEAVAFAPRLLTEGGILPSSIEFLDRRALTLAERFLNVELPHAQAGAHLLIQLEGNDPGRLADDYERVGDLCLASGALEVYVADNRNPRDKLWKARKSVAEAIMAFYTQYAKEDLVVPPSRIPDLLTEVDRLCDLYGLEAANYGHVGDGNVHVNLLLPGRDPSWHQLMDPACRALYEATARFGGTLSGEHGIGLKRKKDVGLFLDDVQLELLRRVKRAFDPQGILNPGKIVP